MCVYVCVYIHTYIKIKFCIHILVLCIYGHTHICIITVILSLECKTIIIINDNNTINLFLDIMIVLNGKVSLALLHNNYYIKWESRERVLICHLR